VLVAVLAASEATARADIDLPSDNYE